MTYKKQRSAYAEKLLDPRWQKKRLLVLERDQWQCQACGDNESTLHVHHRWYEGKDPWDAPDDALVALCETCHDAESEARQHDEKLLLQSLKKRYFSYELYQIEKVLLSMAIRHVCEVQLTAVAWFLSSPEKVDKILEEYFSAECPHPVGWGESPLTTEAANRFKTK